jgi:hypothetical protein
MEAFSEREAQRYLIRDRDAIYGDGVRNRVHSLDMREVVSAPRSPWQNAFVERLIGSIRRECFDHIAVLNNDICGGAEDRLLSSLANAFGAGQGRSRHVRSIVAAAS